MKFTWHKSARGYDNWATWSLTDADVQELRHELGQAALQSPSPVLDRMYADAGRYLETAAPPKGKWTGGAA